MAEAQNDSKILTNKIEKKHSEKGAETTFSVTKSHASAGNKHCCRTAQAIRPNRTSIPAAVHKHCGQRKQATFRINIRHAGNSRTYSCNLTNEIALFPRYFPLTEEMLRQPKAPNAIIPKAQFPVSRHRASRSSSAFAPPHTNVYYL
ncbi:hypothetical protein [Bacteroides ndongoniae]|uniref:hypothetical protein n=1 Tax=Bacteroides ndongoniae TaxID=1903262 RepID=UPI0013563149|nr:hypothetical protein [Bacteroides ndongoniae]